MTPKQPMKPDPQRMLLWLTAGVLLYYVALAIVGPNSPAVQTIFYKVGHVTTLAWVGYWVSRQALGRVTGSSSPTDRLARAVIIAGVIIAGSMGL